MLGDGYEEAAAMSASTLRDKIDVPYRAIGERMKVASVASLAILLVLASPAKAQIEGAASFGSRNTYSVFFDYSNDSSHIILGTAEGRKFTELGFQYEPPLEIRSTSRLEICGRASPADCRKRPYGARNNRSDVTPSNADDRPPSRRQLGLQTFIRKLFFHQSEYWSLECGYLRY